MKNTVLLCLFMVALTIGTLYPTVILYKKGSPKGESLVYCDDKNACYKKDGTPYYFENAAINNDLWQYLFITSAMRTLGGWFIVLALPLTFALIMVFVVHKILKGNEKKF